MKHPHFDQGLIVWDDLYSGRYPPPTTGYPEQFDLQWKIALEGNREYFDVEGVSTEDEYIKDRVLEWTGKRPGGGSFHGTGRVLDYPIDPELIRGKSCIDVGCGMGRWTRTMQMIGAKDVLSVDISESGLKSTSKFNANTLRADITRLPEEHPELGERFDFANFWGVAMCTHDPRRAFLSAASTVRKGGYLFLMVYAPTGMHNTKLVNAQRTAFSKLTTVEDRLRYVDHVWNREWDWDWPLVDNLKNVTRRMRRIHRGAQGKHGVLDMLEPHYNWVIPKQVIAKWMRDAGFDSVKFLNEHEPRPVASHVLGRKTP